MGDRSQALTRHKCGDNSEVSNTACLSALHHAATHFSNPFAVHVSACQVAPSAECSYTTFTLLNS